MDLGDLRRYLSKKKEKNDPVGSEEKLFFCSQVACGLAYLSSLGIVHRDVAARNVLLKSNPDGMLLLCTMQR